MVKPFKALHLKGNLEFKLKTLDEASEKLFSYEGFHRIICIIIATNGQVIRFGRSEEKL